MATWLGVRVHTLQVWDRAQRERRGRGTLTPSLQALGVDGVLALTIQGAAPAAQSVQTSRHSQTLLKQAHAYTQDTELKTKCLTFHSSILSSFGTFRPSHNLCSTSTSSCAARAAFRASSLIVNDHVTEIRTVGYTCCSSSNSRFTGKLILCDSLILSIISASLVTQELVYLSQKLVFRLSHPDLWRAFIRVSGPRNGQVPNRLGTDTGLGKRARRRRCHDYYSKYREGGH